MTSPLRPFRSLLRAPLFTAVVVVTLAVGIGANTVVFSVVDGTILNPFPFPEPDRLVGVGTVFPRLDQDLGFWEVLSPAEYEDIARESRTLEEIVAWDMGNRQIAGAAGTDNVFTAFWWEDALPTLGMEPALGRGFLPGETERGDAVAIISHRLWTSRYGSDPGVLGSTLRVNGEPYTLVGVLPPRTLVYGTDLWIPMPIAPDAHARNRRQFQVLARLAPGVTLEETNAELEGLSRRIEAAWGEEFEEYVGWHLVASTWTDINARTVRPAGLVLMGAVGLVLLLVCANLANLFLARALRRRRELALRRALGAGRHRILAQLLGESTVLSLAGGTAGIGLSYLGLRALLRTVDVLGLPLPAEPGINARVLLFTAAISLLTGLLVGLAPGLRISGAGPARILQSGGTGSTPDRHRHRLQRTLVGVETAVALALLIGSGLLMNSFLRLQRVDPGFETDDILTMRLTLPWEEYDTPDIMTFFQDFRERLEALPGVRSAVVANQFPPQVFMDRQFTVEGEVYGEGATLPSAYLTLVSPGYFEAMEIPLLSGRTLHTTDRIGSTEVAVVNRAAADRFFAGMDAVGRRLRIGGPGDGGTWIEVVGVVEETRNRGLDTRPGPEIYGSTHQIPAGNQFFILIRAENDPRSLLPAVRRTVAAMDPDQPIYAVRTMDEVLSGSIAPRRIAALALAFFSAFALLLASMGIYSVVAFGVAERRREMGLRLALGAEAAQVRRLVVRQALLPVLVGGVAGLGLAFGLQGFLQSLLFEISPTDPLTFLGVTGLLLAIATLASWLPARKATRADPAGALRNE